jgi:transcriptional regulator with XRE-family HTH domain
VTEADLSRRIAQNLKLLRNGRGLTQGQMAKLAGLPRATWTNLESGAANPTVVVLYRVAAALQVSIEELISAPRAVAKHYPKSTLVERLRSDVRIRSLLPDKIPGMEIDRMELPPLGQMVGVPHTPGTREYLTCEVGEIVLTVGGESYALTPGDVVVFRGDQRHAYRNPTRSKAISYSIVVLAPLA